MPPSTKLERERESGEQQRPRNASARARAATGSLLAERVAELPVRDARDIPDVLLAERLVVADTAARQCSRIAGVILRTVVRERIARRRPDDDEADRRHDEDDDQRLRESGGELAPHRSGLCAA